MMSVSMKRTVQRSAAVFKARAPFAGLSLCLRLDTLFLLKHAAFTPILGTDAAFAATTPVRANNLAI